MKFYKFFLLVSIFSSTFINDTYARQNSDIKKDLWEMCHDSGSKAISKGANFLGQNIAEQGKGFARGLAFDALDCSSDEIGRAAASKFHALLYRDPSVHVVDDEGKHIGFVESVAPRLVRNILKNQLGVDLESSFPGVPNVVMKVIGNYLENRVASMIEGQVFDLAKKATRKATIESVGKTLGLTQQQIRTVLQKQGSSKVEKIETSIDQNDLDSQIKSQLSADVQKDEEETYGNIAADLIRNFSARLKISLNSYIRESVEKTANYYSRKLIDDMGERSLRYGESIAGAGLLTIAGAVSGGSGVAIVTTAINADKLLAEGGHQDSFMRRSLKWLTGYDVRKEEVKEKSNYAVTTSLNVNEVLKQSGLTSLVPTESDFDSAYGTYESRQISDEEIGEWTTFDQKKPAVNFTKLFEDARDALAAAKQKAIDDLSTAKQKVVEEANIVNQAFWEAGDEFVEALHPGINGYGEDVKSDKTNHSSQNVKKSFWKFW